MREGFDLIGMYTHDRQSFIDDDQSITGTVAMNEGVESSLVSLSGLTVTIRQDIGCGGTVVLQGTVP